MSGVQQSHFPSLPPGHDRTPSFGAGTGTPFSAAPRPKSSATLYVSIGVVSLGLAVIGGVVISKQRSAPAADPVTTPAGDYSIDVRTTPENAVVEIDGAAAGTGHVVRSFPRDKQSHVLRVSAPNHETLLTQFDDQRPPPTLLVLRSIGAPTVIAGSASAVPAPPRPPVMGGAPVPKGGGPKGKTDRPRTDNIDPWE
jgi:hypothetical protein